MDCGGEPVVRGGVQYGRAAGSAGVVCTCFKFNSVNCTRSPELSLLLVVRVLYQR